MHVVLVVGVPETKTNHAPLERGGPPGGPWVGAGTGIATTKRPPHRLRRQLRACSCHLPLQRRLYPLP
jgi:hypothetical protein